MTGKLLAKSPAVPVPMPEPQGDEPEQLLLMQWVLAQKSGCDQTDAQKATRKWLKANPGAFMASKVKLEEALLASRGAKRDKAGNEKEAGMPDEGTARCRELIEAMLGE